MMLQINDVGDAGESLKIRRRRRPSSGPFIAFYSSEAEQQLGNDSASLDSIRYYHAEDVSYLVYCMQYATP